MAGINIVIFNTSAPINKEKLDFAAELNIVAVNEKWLTDSIKRGVKQDPDQYLIKMETPTVPVDYEPTKARPSVPKPSFKSR